jgi:hypothetical protein
VNCVQEREYPDRFANRRSPGAVLKPTAEVEERNYFRGLQISSLTMLPGGMCDFSAPRPR